MSTLFTELKRRNVLRVAAAYTVVGWVVLQAVDVVAPILELPDWFARGILVVLAVGLPITVVISWFYEWTPEGVMTEEAAVAAGYAKPAGFGRQIDFVIIALLLVAVGLLAYDRSRLDERMLFSPDAPSIAVLPFVNRSQSADMAYFSDGLAEDILNRLALARGLTVTARQSSFTFRDSDETPAEIGRRLGVDTLLEGSVERFAGQVRVTVQLVSARSGSAFWADSFTAPLGGVFSIQNRIIEGVLGLLVPGAEAGEITPPPASTLALSFQVYDLYLQGLYHLNHFIAADQSRPAEVMLEIAIDYFSRAIALSPGLSVAWADRAMARNYLSGAGVRPRAEKLILADIEKALELGPGLGQVQMRAGQVWTGDIERSLGHLDRAVEINPNLAEAHARRSELLRYVGRYEESFDAAELAYRLDPLDNWASEAVTYVYLYRGQHDLLERTIEESRGNQWQAGALMNEAFVQFQLGRMHRLAALELASDNIAGYRDAWAISARGRFGAAYLTLGLLDKAREWTAGQYDDAFLITAGQYGDAIAFLEKEWAAIEAAGGRREPVWVFRYKYDIAAWLVHAYVLAGRYREAVAFYDEVGYDGRLVYDRRLQTLARGERMNPPWAEIPYVYALRKTGDGEKAAELLALFHAELEDRLSQGIDLADHYFELARILVLEGDLEGGLGALETAIDKGWRRWYLDFDPVLEPVRALTGYAPLKASYDADIARQRALAEATLEAGAKAP